MFFYSFSSYHSFDRVLNIQTTGGNPGDLFLIDGKYMLCLGETIAFQSLYEKLSFPLEKGGQGGFGQPKLILIEATLLSPLTMRMIHDFVNHRFTTYKNAIPLRLPDDIDTLLKRKPISKLKSKAKKINAKQEKQAFSPGQGGHPDAIGEGVCNRFDNAQNNIYNGLSLQDFNKQLTDFIDSETNQQRLILFPSFWIMSQTLDLDYFKQKSGYLVMTSKTSPKQKDDAFRALKTGAAHTLITTHSQIFQDWYDLGYILIIDQHTRYYKNQQDPRYHSLEVCQTMGKLYGAELDMTGISLDM